MNNVVRLADYRDSRPQRKREPVKPSFVALSVVIWLGGPILGALIVWSVIDAFVSAWKS